jgi:hypothetical protein
MNDSLHLRTGGQPFGQAMVDTDNAVTFCCRPSYVFAG